MDQRISHVFIKTQSGKTININFSRSDEVTVYRLAKKLQDLEGIPLDQQRLVFAGRQLPGPLIKDPHGPSTFCTEPLAQFGIRDDSTLHLVLKLSGC